MHNLHAILQSACHCSLALEARTTHEKDAKTRDGQSRIRRLKLEVSNWVGYFACFFNCRSCEFCWRCLQLSGAFLIIESWNRNCCKVIQAAEDWMIWTPSNGLDSVSKVAFRQLCISDFKESLTSLRHVVTQGSNPLQRGVTCQSTNQLWSEAA